MLKAIFTDFNYVLWMPRLDRRGFELNIALAQYYREISSTGVQVYILTSGYMAGSKQVQQQVGDFVSKVFYTHQIGKTKQDTTLYIELAGDLGLDANNCLLIDDSASNTNAALQAGWLAINFANNQSAMEQVNSLLT